MRTYSVWYKVPVSKYKNKTSNDTTRKSRFFVLHPETNPGKIEALEALHTAYLGYLSICASHMLDNHVYSLVPSERQAFFPRAEELTSQLEKNVREHAVQFVSGWASGRYTNKIKGVISKLFRLKQIDERQKKALYTIGKYLVHEPSPTITQEDIDLYHKLLDEEGGNRPQVRDSLPMYLSEMTAVLEKPKKTSYTALWIKISCLTSGKRLCLPLADNPYVSSPEDVSKGVMVRKDKRGRWRFEFVEKEKYELPKLPPDSPRLGIDVGLNVLAAVSNGDLYGAEFKPKFDRLYNKVKDVRANRQRQGLLENSKRPDRLESRLSGSVKTAVGTATNLLVKRHPKTIFVVEDLDLRGCKGQKRFAYRALQRSLEAKAVALKVNPAYTSQECPSCGHVSGNNRSGVKFSCKVCGKKSHADWVGASNILGRSKDESITCNDYPNQVKKVLRERYLSSRKGREDSSVGSLAVPISKEKGGARVPNTPMGRKFTTEVSPHGEVGTASNSMLKIT